MASTVGLVPLGISSEVAPPKFTVPLNVTVPSASMLDEPMSILPKPEVIEPAFNAPTVTSWSSEVVAFTVNCPL